MEMSDLRKLNASPPQLASNKDVLTRSNSRSKGINFNTVTPSPLKECNSRPETKTRLSMESRRTPHHSQASGAYNHNLCKPTPLHQNFQYEFALPLAEQLRGIDIEEQLRLLALKEMNVVEIKDEISNLKSKLDQTERDLRQLREVIQHSLYKELNMHRPTRHAQAGPKSQKAQTHVKPTRRPTKSSSTSASGSIETNENQHPPAADRLSKIWSNLAKPITFIQQIDTMLLNEFEKSLIADQRTLLHANRAQLTDLDSDSDVSPLKDKSNLPKQPSPTNYYLQMLQSSGNSEDMFQAVSSSLWSFVNDVKTNMLATLNEQIETPEATIKDQDATNLTPEPESLNSDLECTSALDISEMSEDDETTD